MFKEVFLNKLGTTSRCALASIVLITNVFIWYFCAFGTLKGIIDETGLNYFDTFVVWSASFGGAAFSALIGAVLPNKTGKRTTLLAFWIILGVFSSLALALINTRVTSNIIMLSSLFGVSFGFGLPVCLAYYSDSTAVENRAGLGGVMLLISSAGTFMLLEVIMMVDSIFIHALILATWRGLSLTIFLFINRLENVKKGRSFSYSFILSQKSFLIYFTPWVMFSLINSLSVPMQLTILGEALVKSLLLVEYVLGGAFAIIGGFLSDYFGRKRMTITGFVVLGLGYAILGIFPENLVSWYFYTIVDGVAWGIFSTIFLITIWGDLAYGAPSEKYYALGGLPYLLSSFLQFILKPYIAETIPAYAIFSFTAFFLFLAVIPLMYAPETLPEKKIRERELRKYVEKAKKIKEKYA